MTAITDDDHGHELEVCANTMNTAKMTDAFEQLCELREALLRLHAVAKAARNDGERVLYN